MTALQPIPKIDTYQQFQAEEGIPVVTGFFVEDMETVEVKPWARMGGLGTYINLDGTGGTNDCYVCEIPPGKELNPERHMYEEMIYVVKGRGATRVGNDEGARHSFEWQAGSVFSIPLNTWHQHFNGSGTDPVRFAAVTNAPLVMNLFHSLDFVFDNPFTFADRGCDPRWFQGEGHKWQGDAGGAYIWETNLIPDIRSFPLGKLDNRGAGGSNVLFELANNTMTAHCSEFPVGRYKKAHRHGPGAHVMIISGRGFSLLWPKGGDIDSIQRVDWRPGSVVVPPSDWFHQHFNTGATPARYLALRWGSRRYQFSLGTSGVGDSFVSQKEGGLQIEYEDEDPRIHSMFEEDLQKHGAPCRMRSFVGGCTGVDD